MIHIKYPTAKPATLTEGGKALPKQRVTAALGRFFSLLFPLSFLSASVDLSILFYFVSLPLVGRKLGPLGEADFVN